MPARDFAFGRGIQKKSKKAAARVFFFFFTLPARPKTTDTHASEIHKTNIRLNIQNIQKKKKKKKKKKFGKPNKSWKIGLSLSRS